MKDRPPKPPEPASPPPRPPVPPLPPFLRQGFTNEQDHLRNKRSLAFTEALWEGKHAGCVGRWGRGGDGVEREGPPSKSPFQDPVGGREFRQSTLRDCDNNDREVEGWNR